MTDLTPEARAAAALADFLPNENRAEGLLHAAVSARTVTEKICLLRSAADLYITAIKRHVVCSRGCNFCCWTGVRLSEREARIIAEETGRPLTIPDYESVRENDDASLSPCPFLGERDCTIYAFRPLVCRVYFSAENDPTLCDTKKMRREIAMINVIPFLMRAYSRLDSFTKIADIRDFFKGAP